MEIIDIGIHLAQKIATGSNIESSPAYPAVERTESVKPALTRVVTLCDAATESEWTACFGLGQPMGIAGRSVDQSRGLHPGKIVRKILADRQPSKTKAPYLLPCDPTPVPH
jgi:hypothetical protein